MAENNKFQELKNLVEKSSLGQEDKDFWFGFLERLEQYQDVETKESIERGLGYILDYLQAEPDKLEWLADILRRKVEALGEMDMRAWQEVLKEEAGFLES